MSEFMLVLRGSAEDWNNLGESTRREIIEKHMAWSQKLRLENRLKGGNGLGSVGKKIVAKGNRFEVIDAPYAETKEALTGYYVIEAKDMEEALEIAHDCPALTHGESVEVIEIGI